MSRPAHPLSATSSLVINMDNQHLPRIPTVAGSGAARPGGRMDLSDGTPARKPEPPKPSTLIGATMGVEFDHHWSGAQQVKFYDKRTGEVIEVTPSDKVLDAVATLVDSLRRKV
jgi:hypothetical protein